jgi:lipoic acid synthetase
MSIFFELPVLENSSDITYEKPLPPHKSQQIPQKKLPDWFRIQIKEDDTTKHIRTLLQEHKLHTVCQEARCPNLSECWKTGTATFMLGGDTCTRACRFCAVKTARIPPALDPDEPEKIAKAVNSLNLKYVVLTSVNRDDLADGASLHFAKTIQKIKQLNSQILVEALVPDFQGDPHAIQTVANSGVDVYAHNLETVQRLQKKVRDPRANFEQSLATLRFAKKVNPQIFTKSSLMLGLGETTDELKAAFVALKEAQVSILTLGQYLRPSLEHLPVERFLSPEEFEFLKTLAQKTAGFDYIAAGPMVRSSYKAAELFVQNHRHT